MSWPHYYTNGSGFSTTVPPRSVRQQGLALVGLDCEGGMSETLNSALAGFSDAHLAAHYHPSGAPYSHSVERTAWLTAQPCHPHPGICTCNRCPEGMSYTGGVALGGGLPIKLSSPEFEYLSPLAHRLLPVLTESAEPKPLKWRDFPRMPPKPEEVAPKPPGWDAIVTMEGFERHAPECPRLRDRAMCCICSESVPLSLLMSGAAHVHVHAHTHVHVPPRTGVWAKVKKLFK